MTFSLAPLSSAARAFRLAALAAGAAALAACGGGNQGSKIARDVGVPDYSVLTKSGVETSVNRYLWTASLETLDFLPLSFVDPYAGLIVSDWHSDANAPNERLKANIYILDKRLRTDAVRVSVFRQVRTPTGWEDRPVAPTTAREIENAILTRAREIRLNTAG
ncbi:MAG: DUF3576 domain-containing protein [Pseudomonadota bacterium]